MSDSSSLTSPRTLLADLFRTAVTAVAPGAALEAALVSRTPEPGRRVHILALGKAAHPMAVAAVEHLHRHGQSPAGGIVIGPALGPSPDARLDVVMGDHPEPGAHSLEAAERLAVAVREVGPDDDVWVLLSGGTTSLIGAPVPGITPADLSTLYASLLASGLDIAAMNRIRKRFSRWGAGRLAATLAPARVKNFTISDVIGDDLASIGSGPCVPDETKAAEVRSLLTSASLWEKIPEAMRRLVLDVERGVAAETPKSGDPALEKVEVQVIASNRLALEAVAARAVTLGLDSMIMPTTLAGEAAETGARIAERVLEYGTKPGSAQPGLHKHTVLIWGGETTVTLGDNPGIGGRSQELALSAARVLARGNLDATLMAAGTDGRDGPTDAAGGIVNRRTWDAIRAAGRDPARDLERHCAYDALAAAGDLFQTGLTGTNVMDIVIAVVPASVTGPRIRGA
jgi:hydroxypyruvate reductase